MNTDSNSVKRQPANKMADRGTKKDKNNQSVSHFGKQKVRYLIHIQFTLASVTHCVPEYNSTRQSFGERADLRWKRQYWSVCMNVVSVCVCLHLCVVSHVQSGEGGPLGLEVCRVRMRTGKVRKNRRHLSGNESEVSIRTGRMAVKCWRWEARRCVWLLYVRECAHVCVCPRTHCLASKSMFLPVSFQWRILERIECERKGERRK